jgi:hypothetical protein
MTTAAHKGGYVLCKSFYVYQSREKNAKNFLAVRTCGQQGCHNKANEKTRRPEQ